MKIIKQCLSYEGAGDLVNIAGSDSGGLGWGSHSVFLPSSKVVPTLLVWGLAFGVVRLQSNSS